MFNLLTHFLTTYAIGFYIITAFQWYNYKFKRVLFHYHKYLWHLLYFIIPIVTYIAAEKFFWIYFYFGLLPSLLLWFKRTKGLVITQRVKRFFLILGILESFMLILVKNGLNSGIGVLIVIILSLLLSNLTEYIIFLRYKKLAKNKLEKISPTIISITASYGKTSIKNYLYQILKDKFKVYKTPRSVNTLKGIVKDINIDLKDNIEIYITEAGAREKNDIYEIVEFLENQYAILGKIGEQHIEYFKNIDNIKNTKLRVFDSKRLIKGFSYELPYNEKVLVIKDKISNIKSSLNGIEWDLEIDNQIHHFSAPKILGSFNAINISLAIFQSKEFINDIEYIKQKIYKLEPIPHRLEKIEVAGKIIIDDGFNGNLEGMLDSFELVKEYPGRKIIVTPGIVEANKKQNIEIAKKIDSVFDIAIIIGNVNKKTICDNIHNIEKICTSRNNIENILKEISKTGDLIIFSNDTPNYL